MTNSTGSGIRHGLPGPDELRNNEVVKNVGAAQEEQTTGERSTRNRVARSILDHGPSTTADLAERLGLTQAAVRRHLDHLVAENIVEPREQRVYGARTRGRPAKVFSLTDCGRDAFDQAYDQIAADALRWIAQSAGGGETGDAAVTAFARARVAKQADRYRAAVDAADPAQRTQALAKALSEDGYAATTRSASAVSGAREPAGEQLCQHHCPVAHIAEEFPQLCEAEAEVFSHVLGTHVQRLATIAHGDGVCTTYIPQHPQHQQKQQAGTAVNTDTAVINASASTAGRNPA